MGPALNPVRVGELHTHSMHHKFLCTVSIQHGLQVMGQNHTVEGCAMTGCCLTGALLLPFTGCYSDGPSCQHRLQVVGHAGCWCMQQYCTMLVCSKLSQQHCKAYNTITYAKWILLCPAVLLNSVGHVSCPSSLQMPGTNEDRRLPWTLGVRRGQPFDHRMPEAPLKDYKVASNGCMIKYNLVRSFSSTSGANQHDVLRTCPPSN